MKVGLPKSIKAIKIIPQDTRHHQGLLPGDPRFCQVNNQAPNITITSWRRDAPKIGEGGMFTMFRKLTKETKNHKLPPTPMFPASDSINSSGPH